MALVIAIEPRRSINAARASAGALSLVGALSHVVAPGPPVIPLPIFKSVTGSLTPVGSLATVVSGPSIETKTQSASGTITLEGGYSDEVVEGPPIGVSTLDVAGSIDFSGIVAGEVSGPSLVTIIRNFSGLLGPGSTLIAEGITPEPPPPTILTQDVDGEIAPVGDVATAVSGPSIETLTEDVDGTITPAGDLTTDTIAPPVTEFFKSVAGGLSLAGSVIGAKSGPDLVTIPKSVSGSLGLSAVLVPVIAPTFSTKTQSVAGTVTPSGSLATAVSGPSIETKLKSIAGTLAPAGARSAIVIAPPPTFFSKDVAGMITPTGSLSRLVTGPSFETKTKAIAGSIAPSSVLSRSVSGPSFEIKPKSVAGLLTPAGTVARQAIGNPQIVTKTVTGTITPQGARSAVVIESPPTGGDPVYTSMGAWETHEFDRHPQWPGITFTRVPSTTANVKAMLDAMRARGMKGGPGFTNKNDMGDAQQSGGWVLNLTKFRGLVDRIAAVSNIQSYIIDGTFTILCIGDEFEHTLWNNSVDGNDLKTMCQYVKQRLPGVKTTVRMRRQQLCEPPFIPTGGWNGELDYGWAQYTGPNRAGANGQTALEYYIDQRDSFNEIGIPKLVTGLNWWNGGDGSSGVEGENGPGFWVASAQEIRNSIDAAVQIPESDYYMLWTDGHDSGLGQADRMLAIQETAAYRDAFLYVKTTGLARGATVQPPVFFTDPGHFAAPHPPPAIALGAGVRDGLTTHKVFRLVDNARLQDAEYPAFNEDNSIIYYIKGTTGYIANVSWNLPQSTVQVSNERVANGTTTPVPVYDGWIWARNNRAWAYYAASPAGPRICRRDVVLATTTVVKSFNPDSRYSNFWSALGVTNSRLTGLHANRLQEVFVAKVHNNTGGAVVGAVAWRSTDGLLWNYQPVAGKTIDRVMTDDAGEFLVVYYTDGSWQAARLNANGTITRSTNASNGPKRDDIASIGGSQQSLQASGLGVRTWDLDPLSTSPSTLYSHPQRSAKQNVYEQARLSAQFNDRLVYTMYQDGTIATPWQIHTGSTYKLNWAAEQVAAPNKLAPDVLRVNGIQYTRTAPPL